MIEVEALAKIIDPEAFGLPAWKPTDGSDYLTDRDEARDKAQAIASGLVADRDATWNTAIEMAARTSEDYASLSTTEVPKAIRALLRRKKEGEDG